MSRKPLVGFLHCCLLTVQESYWVSLLMHQDRVGVGYDAYVRLVCTVGTIGSVFSQRRYTPEVHAGVPPTVTLAGGHMRTLIGFGAQP